MQFLESIQKNSPKSHKYFQLYYEENINQFKIAWIPFSNLDFSLQLGVFISFFNSVNTDVDIYSNEIEALKDAIEESFNTYEEYLFLDS